MNGDGFGIGWYHTNRVKRFVSMDRFSHDGGVETGTSSTLEDIVEGQALPDDIVPVSASVFKDIFPAWNNMNLQEICEATVSNCIVAHVRAASKGTGVSHQNCHPFKAGRLLFCHNGRIPNFQAIRRRFLTHLSDRAFRVVKGTTDSEIFFALCLTILENDGEESPYKQKKPFGHKRLVAALKKTLTQIEHILMEANATSNYSTFNFSLTDGETMVVTRFCNKSPDVPPPSLYFAFGDSESMYQELTDEQSSPLFMETMMKKSISSTSLTATTDSSSDSDSSGEGVGNDSSDDYDESAIILSYHESKPGKILVDEDPSTATFIVASNPLTRTHTWHPMPRNSIMWCTRGGHPELRLLKRRKIAATKSFVIEIKPVEPVPKEIDPALF